MLALQELRGRDDLKQRLLNLADAADSFCLLFMGAQGLGKKTLARAYAQLLLCGKRKKGEFACNSCSACNYVKAKSHPDLLELLPTAENAALSVDQVREFAAKEPYLQALLGDKRVFILDLDAINVSGQNLLLKTLESSAPTNFFLLLSSNYEKVLPTVHSRAQSLTLPHLTSDDMQKLLSDLLAAEGEASRQASQQMQQLISFAKGNPGFLQQLLQDEDFLAYYADLSTLFTTAKRNCNLPYFLAELYPALEKYKEKDERLYLAQIWTFLLAKEAYTNLQYAHVYEAWQSCLANLQANGNFELQLQAFLTKWQQLLAAV